MSPFGSKYLCRWDHPAWSWIVAGCTLSYSAVIHRRCITYLKFYFICSKEQFVAFFVLLMFFVRAAKPREVYISFCVVHLTVHVVKGGEFGWIAAEPNGFFSEVCWDWIHWFKGKFSLRLMNNFKPNKIIFAIKFDRQFSSKKGLYRKKLILEKVIFSSKFPGRRHFE